MRELSLVTVHYNTADITKECLLSILEHLPEHLEYALIVVDNASRPEELHKLEEFVHSVENPRLYLVKSRINTGFGWGNMIGIQHFPARYYCFINNDTQVAEDVFSPCITFLESEEDRYLCGIQILDPQGRPQVSFDHFATPARELLGSGLLEKLLPGIPKRKKTYREPLRVDYVNGSFMMVRGEAFERVGGFDPQLFLYFEESDLCLRLRKAGGATYFLPGLSYTHIQNASVQKSASGAVKKKELKRSYLYLTRKHYGLAAFAMMWLYLLLRYGFQSLFSPRYVPVFSFLLRGAPMHETLRLKQEIRRAIP